mmetsp:Transcript_38105/g.92216  ORF Transcript_38105/g.92216 Transcript_38105/m.92216 type:complete len:81 (-) Transcript_38105:195-437(-)
MICRQQATENEEKTPLNVRLFIRRSEADEVQSKFLSDHEYLMKEGLRCIKTRLQQFSTFEDLYLILRLWHSGDSPITRDR